LWQEVCGLITRGDFWVMLAKMAVESAEPTKTITIPYQYGRIDATVANGCACSGRLPNAELTVDEMYRVFVTQMGCQLNDAAILLGAHSLGHVHTTVSGYGQSGDMSGGYLNGFDDTPHIFDNNYYYNILTGTWYSGQAPANSSKTNWYSKDSSFTNLCTLPIDISAHFIRTSYTSFQTQTCSQYSVSNGYGCTPSSTIMPLTCWQTCSNANSNSYFLSMFESSFPKMTCAGYGVPACTTGATGSGKLGTLTYLDLTTC